MQFNSFIFLVFFSITYLLYLLSGHKQQNKILLAASYFFYAAWDYRFLSLILFSTAVNFFAGKQIHSNQSPAMRKKLLILTIAVNLSLLGFFKYYNFFADSLGQLLTWSGMTPPALGLHIILPVGISFYTFQTMSYTIDVYRRRIEACDSPVDFSLYVAFFPQLVAGPIERATHFLPQICMPRVITSTQFKTGAFLFLFGLFEKVVVADNLAVLVDSVYNGGKSDGMSVLLATYGFAFQILADFDGYSNMAKGLAAMMGFSLMTNFNAPYFSQTASEFWNRWHISLSSWLRDYLYIPLGGNRHGKSATVRNLIITMLLAGLWHGASWMFILWGGFHALLLVIYHLAAAPIQRLPVLLQRLVFFHLVCFGWLLFRAVDLPHLLSLLNQLLFHFNPGLAGSHLLMLKQLLLYCTIPLLYQFFQIRQSTLYPLFCLPLFARSLSYVLLFYMIVIFGFNNAQSFIYFQF
jgi:D-alanyl-lipoteichoic acid acyltransferase DltB (MBOAT superfamily)